MKHEVFDVCNARIYGNHHEYIWLRIFQPRYNSTALRGRSLITSRIHIDYVIGLPIIYETELVAFCISILYPSVFALWDEIPRKIVSPTLSGPALDQIFRLSKQRLICHKYRYANYQTNLPDHFLPFQIVTEIITRACS